MCETIVALHNVTKQFGSGKNTKQVLSDLCLEVFSQEVYGFLGPNGAGKSTTIKLLLNFIRPDQGSITILDNRVGREEFRSNIGYLSEFPFFYEHLTAYETLFLSGRLSHVSKGILKKRIPQLLTKVNLEDAQHQRISGFSKGMKQRLGLANAIVHDPQLLILDEPMSGLDPLGRNLMKSIISELKNKGKTIFFSSHILSDVEELCDRIGVIHKGCLLYSGTIDNFIVGNNSIEQQFVSTIMEADNAINS